MFAKCDRKFKMKEKLFDASVAVSRLGNERAVKIRKIPN